jgi:hypothetical protein
MNNFEESFARLSDSGELQHRKVVIHAFAASCLLSIPEAFLLPAENARKSHAPNTLRQANAFHAFVTAALVCLGNLGVDMTPRQDSLPGVIIRPSGLRFVEMGGG